MTKKFYQSMKSKFLQGRMVVTTLDIFRTLIAIKTESIGIFENVKKSIFMNEGNLKKIETKDFGPYEEIIDVFNTNLKLLFDNNLVVVNEQKLDPAIVEKYTASLDSLQSYEYTATYNRLKLVDDYFKALFNKISQELNGMYSRETWSVAEVDYHMADVLSFILNGKYLSQTSDNILNDSTALTGEIKAEENDIPVLVYKNELHVNTVQFKVTACFCRALEAIKEFLVLGSVFIEQQGDVALFMLKRVLDIIVMMNSMTTQYILSGGAVICKIVDRIDYDHLAITLSQMRLTEMIMTCIHAKLTSAGISQPKLEDMFKKVLADLQVHGTSIQVKWTDMFVDEILPTIEKSVAQAGHLKATTHLPTDETSQVLSRVKQMHRFVADLGDEGIYTQLFDKFIQKLRLLWIEPFWSHAKTDEAAAKRAREELNYIRDNLAEVKSTESLPAFAGLQALLKNLN